MIGVSTAVATAAVASLLYGAMVALAVVGLRIVARPSAAGQHLLACAGQWVIAAVFVADLWGRVSAGVSGPALASLDAASWSASPSTSSGLGARLPSAWVPWIATAYGIGIAVGCVRWAGAWWLVRRWRRTAVGLAEELRSRWEAQAGRMGLPAVRFAVSAWIDAPLVVGVLRPLVLLPAALLGSPPALSLAQLDALVAHELAHLVRRDPWLAAIQRAIELVLFHNPAVWWLGRVARRTREEATDDRAVAGATEPLVLARALLELREAQSTMAALAATDGALPLRIRRLAAASSGRRRARRRAGHGWSFAWAGAVVVSVVLAPRPVAQAPGRAPVGAMAVAPADAGGITARWLPAAVLQHEAAIVAAARRHDLDPNLLAVVMAVESGGDPEAVSPLGARGLMQLMPSTAAQAARDAGRPPASVQRLADPAYNVDLGAAVLAAQLRTFGGDTLDRAAIERAAAAYNAGPTAVRRWLDHGTPLPEETERYRRRIGELWSRAT